MENCDGHSAEFAECPSRCAPGPTAFRDDLKIAIGFRLRVA